MPRRPFLLVAIALSASCSAPATRATLPSARAPEPAAIRVGVREGNRVTIRKVPFETYVQAAILSEFAPPNGDPAMVERWARARPGVDLRMLDDEHQLGASVDQIWNESEKFFGLG